jgi:hypothetical protein
MRSSETAIANADIEGRAYHGNSIVIERRDGTRTIGKAHAHPLRNNEGQLVGALNLVADITGLTGAEARHSMPHDVSHAYSATLVMIESRFPS